MSEQPANAEPADDEAIALVDNVSPSAEYVDQKNGTTADDDVDEEA